MRHATIAVLLLAALAGAAVAGPFEDAVSAYERGDYTAALRLLRPLAEQGHAVAQYKLGYMYANAEGVPQNYAEAEEWYWKAAELGLADAQYNLGSMYAVGEGVPQDYAEAIRLYRMAAEQGDAGARNNLGFMYSNGQGVPQDYVQAHMWYNLAGAQGDEMGAKNRDIVAALMTPAQIAEAEKLAREWKPK